MTIGEWLQSRAPRPPVVLDERIRHELSETLSAPAAQAPELLLLAGERLVADLLASENTTRDSALDLLTADALVTYAFEAASDDPRAIDALAAASMRRLAVLGDAGAA